MTAYWENDWLGAGVTANSRESNSYNLRMRQAWLFYDNDNYHFNVLAGQAWSMLTANKLGILPGTENAPLTIDAQYAVGFNWARQPQLRFVQDMEQDALVRRLGRGVADRLCLKWNASCGSVPQTALLCRPVSAVNAANACNAGGLLNSTTSCSNNKFPDVIEKVALDPGWGHYEVLGIQRWFTDDVASAGSTLPSSGGCRIPWLQEKTHFGWGIGGSVLLPVIPKFLDLQGSVLTGQGLGRYGSSQLADVTIGPDGTLKPLTTTQVLLGFVAHPWAGLDVYGYAGQEQVKCEFLESGRLCGSRRTGWLRQSRLFERRLFSAKHGRGPTGVLASTLRLPRRRARPTSSAPRNSRSVSGSSSTRGIWGKSGSARNTSSSGCKPSPALARP